jgi:hydroxymethylglutaryl-CoA lyase
MAESVKIIECPRDAWQGLRPQIPTDLKVRYLRGLVDAGFQHLDAVSFVSPKAVPQMGDSEEVLKQLGPVGQVEIIGIVVNEKGAERAISTGSVKTLGYPCSVSETFLRRNQNQSLHENQAILRQIKKRAVEAQLGVVAYISMGFGNPYGDPWSREKVAEMAQAIGAMGIDAVSIADTAGVANPELVRRVTDQVLNECGDAIEVGVHLHTTPAGAADKILAAYDAGCRRFDSAIGGLGGCPFAQDDLVGNVPTEEVVRALGKRGVKLAIKDQLSHVLLMNSTIEKQFAPNDAKT